MESGAFLVKSVFTTVPLPHFRSPSRFRERDTLPKPAGDVEGADALRVINQLNGKAHPAKRRLPS